MVDRAVAGDQAAWNNIVDRMSNMVWSVVRSFRLSEADSTDAAQMAWLRIVEKLDKVNDPERLGLWIATVTRRECLQLIQRRDRVVPWDPGDDFYATSGEGDLQADVANRSDVTVIINALGSMNERCQALLRLVLCDPPMHYREIAAALDIAVGTIGARRQRCLSALRSASGL